MKWLDDLPLSKAISLSALLFCVCMIISAPIIAVLVCCYILIPALYRALMRSGW